MAILVTFFDIRMALLLNLDDVDFFSHSWWTIFEYTIAMKMTGDAPTTQNQTMPYSFGSKGFGQFSMQKLVSLS